MSDLDRYDPEPLQPRREARRRGWILWAAGGALVVGLAAAYLALRPDPGAPATQPPAAGERTAEGAAAAPATPGAAPAIPLPPLDSSDDFVRQRAAALGGAQELASWLSVDHLVRRAAAVLVGLAEGQSPREPLAVLAPAGSFAVRPREGRLFVDPSGYARYDRVAAVLAGVDPSQAAALWRLLRPLLVQAHAEIARPGETVEETLARAIERLVAAPVGAADEAEVVLGDGVGYQFADPELEALSAAEKHLLRMGPENASRIQDWLRALSAELGLAR
jgi:hypothetical protein